MLDDARLPTIVSFAAGDEYYHRQARHLQEACERMGIPHSIDFYDDLGGLPWAELCRFKVRFYQRKLRELKGPILWVDADTDFRGVPAVLAGLRADFAAFPQSQHLNRFDAYTIARMWRPRFLYFGYTEAAQGFIDYMVELDERAPENVTDAYILQEAWATYPVGMSVLVLPTKHIAKSADAVTADTWIIDGDSGNVPKFKDSVLQHGTILNRGELLTSIAGDYMRRKEFGAAEAMLAAASDHGYESAAYARRLSEVMRKRGRKQDADTVLRGFVERNPQDGEARVMGAKLALQDREFGAAAQMLTAAQEIGGLPAMQAESLKLDLDLELRAETMGLAPEERPVLWWMKQPYPGNLGDVLNPYIVEKVTGLPPRFERADRAMLAIGSVIKFAGNGRDVWGAGTPRMTDDLNPAARYHAVRGPLTRELVLKSGGSVPPVYGDPALLMPRFYWPEVEKKYRLGVIRHVSDRTLGVFAEGVRDLNLRRVGYAEMEAFVDELLECEAVVTTSLHGMIIANAYGIPARWAFFSNSPKPIAGDGTKYIDYLRSVSLEDQTPLDLAEHRVLDEALLKHIDPSTAEIRFDADALLDAFPRTASRVA